MKASFLKNVAGRRVCRADAAPAPLPARPHARRPPGSARLFSSTRATSRRDGVEDSIDEARLVAAIEAVRDIDIFRDRLTRAGTSGRNISS